MRSSAGSSCLSLTGGPVCWRTRKRRCLHGEKPPYKLRNTRRKLLEDRFSIVLLADMKAGKSTIFNAVACGGRELSPLGTVIRTSGCEVRAQNLADENEVERAEIVWRTSEGLIRGFDDLLLPRLRELAPHH